MRYSRQFIIFLMLAVFRLLAYATPLDDIARLRSAYPDRIKAETKQALTWDDGTRMPMGLPGKTEAQKLNHPSLYDQLVGVHYPRGVPLDPLHYKPAGDPGRIRYAPFFHKMYGQTRAQIEAKLVTIYWMPAVFGADYPLDVTTAEGVDKKMRQISNDLEKLVRLHPDYIPYLARPAGGYKWRTVSGTAYISPHSFGISLDLNPAYGAYWRHDLEVAGKPIREDASLIYHNAIPWDIVLVFEKHGFIWGGKWYHYDNMHFEYRPELLCCFK